MNAKQWFQRGFILFDDSKINKLISFDDDWQIYTTSFKNYFLIVKNALFQKWLKEGFANEKLFTKFEDNSKAYYAYSSKPEYLISSVEYGPFPDTKDEAIAFANTLRESRKNNKDLSFHDALYLEQCSMLLPTFTFTEPADDKIVLGTWLTSGVKISTCSFRRLCKLLEWMSAKDVEEIINEAGFTFDGQYLVLSKEKEHERDATPKNVELVATGFLKNDKFLLPGRPYLEEFFNEHIVDIIMNQDKYEKMGIEFPSAMILHGPPGCGKTYAIEKLIEFLDWPSYSIDSGSVGSPYIHDTSKKIAEIFDQAIENAPSVIVIDEMEAFLTDRNVGQASGLHHVEEVAEFLRRIPEAVKKKVLVVAMTNMIDSIDQAILRRGRFDHILEVKMPSKQEVESLLGNLLGKLPVSESIDIDKAARLLTGHPLSDVAFVVKEAGRKTVKQGAETINNSILFEVIDSLPKNKNDNRKIGF